MTVHITALLEACKQLNIPYTFLDTNHNLVKVTIGKGYFFSNFSAPFNNHSIIQISKDKEFTCRVIREAVRTPKSIGYLDPYTKKENYPRLHSYEDIVEEISKEFSFPVLVKNNFGEQGKNIFKCDNKDKVLYAVKSVLDQQSKNYSYICLAQEYIHPKEEFRLVTFNGKLSFAYLKDISHATFEGNLSALHWRNARAVLVEDEGIQQELFNFVQPAIQAAGLMYGGIDVIRDTNNILWFIEMNTLPGFAYFVKDNGMEKVVALYKDMLTYLSSQSQQQPDPHVTAPLSEYPYNYDQR